MLATKSTARGGGKTDFRVTTLALLVGLLVSSMSTTTEAQSRIRFSDTPGAQAFLAKDYKRALDEFQKLQQANPNNTLVLRYLAITLDRLSRYDEAIDVFKEALAIVPNNPSLLYHLGVTYYNARRTDAAIDSFNRVLELAPNSRYAELATRYIDAISQQRAQQQRPGAPQRFGTYVQAGVQYDDNVQAATRDQGKISDSRFFGYVSLEYYLHRAPKWLATVEVNGYGTWYKDDRFKPFETSQYGGGLRAQRTGVMGKFPFVGSIKYAYSEAHLPDSGKYSSSHALTFGMRVNFTKGTSTYGYYRYTDDDFTNEGFDPAFSSRDADNHLIGLRQTWYFADRQGQVSATLEYQKNDAKGVNFEMDRISGRIKTIIPLPWQLRLEFVAGYGEDDYEKFASTVRRETERKRFTAGLSRWFGPHVLVRFDYSYLDEDSTIDSLIYDREVLGASVSYVY